MSIEVNSTNLEIEIKETMSFKHHVEPIYNEIKEDISFEAEENPNDVNMNEFAKHELIDSERLEILEKVKEHYEYETYRNDREVSIFDEYIIRSAIAEWIDENYDFYWE
jgi:hypothetical protein